MIEQIAQNWLCWVILLLALFCYQQLLLDLFSLRNTDLVANASTVEQIAEKSQHHQEFMNVLIGALPLLGLLGTIIGLLDCFAGITSDGVNSELMSGGIGDALLTTQLGLVCAIPAWVLHAYLRAYWQREFATAQNVMG